MVEVDAGGEGQQSLCRPDSEVGERASAVALQTEDVLEGLVDGLDPLASGCQAKSALGLVGAGRAQHQPAHLGHRPLEVAAGVALVADDRLAAAQHPRKQLQRDLALRPVGRPQNGPAGRPVEPEAAVQAHPPKPARVALAAGVAAGVGQLRALDGLHRPAALDRGRVEQDDVIVVAGALGGEDADEPLDRLREPEPALVKAGLLRQLGEEMREALLGHGQEAPVGGTPMTACATQSVTTSASVTLRRAFPGLSGRRSSAVQKRQ